MTNYDEISYKQTNLPRRQFLAVFAETDALTQKETGREMVRENLHRAASVKKDMVYCPCRLCRLTPRGDEELLARYTEASRAIRETAVLRGFSRRRVIRFRNISLSKRLPHCAISGRGCLITPCPRIPVNDMKSACIAWCRRLMAERRTQVARVISAFMEAASKGRIFGARFHVGG